MDALVMRISQLDTEAAGALRVVTFYDTLMRRRVDLPALARASAGLAECVAGIRLHGSGRVVRFAPDGREATEPVLAGSTTAPITLDDEEIGTAWLERSGARAPLDDTVLERLAIAVAAVVERDGPARTTMADPALVELAISSENDEPTRARALRLLGFSAELPLRIAAVRSPQPLERLARLVSSTRPAKAARLADLGVILATTIQPEKFPVGTHAGIGEPDTPDVSWLQARTALRFTTPGRPIVHHEDLGSLALLAQVPEHLLRANADVAAVARIADNPDDLETLDLYFDTGSVRRAADQLHLHHSSVARRLHRIGTTLEMDVTEPTGLFRARLALTAWRLAARRSPEGSRRPRRTDQGLPLHDGPART